MVAAKLKRLGMEVKDEQMPMILERVKEESLLRKGIISEPELASIARRVIGT